MFKYLSSTNISQHKAKALYAGANASYLWGDFVPIYNNIIGFSYGGGGSSPSANAYKMIYATDVRSAVSSANITNAGYTGASASNTTSVILGCCGNTGNLPSTSWPQYKRSNKMTLNVEVTSLTNEMNTFRAFCITVGGNSDYAYMHSGEDKDRIPSFNSTEKYNFSTNVFTEAPSSAWLSTKTGQHSTFSDGSTIFISCGGYNQFSATRVGRTEKMPISTETTSTVSSMTALNTRRSQSTGYRLNTHYYLICGEILGSSTSSTEKMSVGTQTTSVGPTSAINIGGPGAYSSTSKIYSFCGYTSTYSPLAQILTLSTDTWASATSYPVSIVVPAAVS